jgi:transforming growth factor-beta-induced protein
MRKSYRFMISAILCMPLAAPALANPGHTTITEHRTWITGMPYSTSGAHGYTWHKYRYPQRMAPRYPQWMAPHYPQWMAPHYPQWMGPGYHHRSLPPLMRSYGAPPRRMTNVAPGHYQPWGHHRVPHAKSWAGGASGKSDGYGGSTNLFSYGGSGSSVGYGSHSSYGVSEQNILSNTGQANADRMDANSIVAVAQAAGGFNTLLAAATAGGLAEALATSGPFTVFAPLDAAFAELPQAAVNNLLQPENRAMLTSLLQHHVVAGRLDAVSVLEASQIESLAGTPLVVRVDGDTVRIGGVRILQTDIAAENGIIHVVEQVLFPEGFACIATVAQRAGQFETLLAAAEAAGLIDALSVQGPFTVFAPTDAAFAALPDGTVANLLLPENRTDLQRLLQNHIVAGRIPASDVLANTSLETLAGTQLAVSLDGEQPRIGGVAIAATDILAGNGIIHVVDEVLIP